MKVKLQIMIEETLKENFIKVCEQEGRDMSEVIREKIHQFIKENGGVKMEKEILTTEELEEIWEDADVEEVQDNGSSGKHTECNWYTVKYKDGKEKDVYVKRN